MRNPVTPREMYDIVPRGLQHSDFMAVLTTHYFGRDGSQHRLWTLRNNPDEAIRIFRIKKAHEIEQVRKYNRTQETANTKPPVTAPKQHNTSDTKTPDVIDLSSTKPPVAAPKQPQLPPRPIQNQLQTNFPGIHARPGEGYKGGLGQRSER